MDKLNNHTSSLSKLYFILTVILLGVVSFECMRSVDNTVEAPSSLEPIVTMLGFLIALPWLFFTRYGSDQQSLIHRRIIILLFIFVIWAIIATFCIPAFPMNFNGKIIKCISLFLPILAFSAGYTHTKNNLLALPEHFSFIIVFLLLVVQYYSIYTSMDSNGHNIGVSYYPLVVLPLLLLNPNKIVRVISILITTAILFSAGKRGGMVAFMLALIVYFFLSSAQNKSTIKRFFVLLFVFAGLAGMFVIIYQQFDTDLLLRFSTAKEDGGSGRLDIWSDIAAYLHKESWTDFLIGNGYLGSMDVNRFGYSAHNDFLEIVCDFGLMGLIPYIACIFTLCASTKYMIASNAQYAAPLAMSVIIFLVLSMVSIVILYSLISLFFLEFGVFLGCQTYCDNTITNQKTIPDE